MANTGTTLNALVISPEVAALAMSGSSALVAVNALLLKHTRLAGIGGPSAVKTVSGFLEGAPRNGMA